MYCDAMEEAETMHVGIEDARTFNNLVSAHVVDKVVNRYAFVPTRIPPLTVMNLEYRILNIES